jgi:hypothetical protein
MRTSIFWTTSLLTLALAACKGEDAGKGEDKAAGAKQDASDNGTDTSKEAQACRAERKWAGIENLEPTELARCVESTKQDQADLHLSDEQYQALLDCKIAAKDLSEGVKCMAEASKHSIDATFAKVEQKHAAELEAALAKLEAHVESGAITEQTLALLRNPDKSTPAGRVAEVATEAAALLDAGRVAAGESITIQLQPGLGADTPEPKGLEGAELVFVDAKTKSTVGRLAPLNVDLLGAKSPQVAALLDWMLEDSKTRQAEIVVTTTEESGMAFDPPEALRTAMSRFEAAGIAERPVIWLDGTPMTLAQWAERG